MLSKMTRTSIKLIVFVAIAAGLAQCSYFFGEKKKKSEVEYSQQVGSCIGPSNQVFARYFSQDSDNDVSGAELDQFNECYQDSIESLITYTKSGRLESDDFSAENIELLIRRFHPEVELSVDRIRGYIRLKSFLIGGSEDTISKNELRTIKQLLPLVAEGLKKMYPYRSIWLHREILPRTQEGYQDFDAAFRVLKEEVGNVLAHLDEFQGRREIDVLEVSEFLLKEILKNEFSTQLKYLPLIQTFKNFVVFENGERLKRNNLSLFTRQVILTYEAISRFDFFLKEVDNPNAIFTSIGHLSSFITKVPSQLDDSNLFRGVGLRALNDIYSSGEAILNYSLRSRPNQKVPMDRLQDVILALEEAGIMEGQLTGGTLSYFIRSFSKKWLSLDASGDPDFSLQKIQYIRGLIEKWMRRQQMVNTLFANTNEDSISLLNYQDVLPDQPEMVEWHEMFRRGSDDKEISTHQWDAHHRVQYSRDITHFNYQELTVSNSILLLTEVFMKPFNINESDLLKYKVTAEQAQEIYELVRILGVEMAFMDSRVDDSGFRSFRETNNFSTQKNSDLYLDFYEGYEYLAVAINSGELADWIYDDLPKTDQCTRDVQGVHRRDTIDVSCFRDFLKTNFLQYFGHLTSISEYWRNANDLQRTVFLRSLEVASRAGIIRDKPYDLSEIRVTVTILSYLEAIFYMFDREHRNGFADGIETSPGDSELRRAELHFRPLILDFLVNKKPEVMTDNEWIIRQACGRNSTLQERLDCMAPKIFIHLLRRGNLPLDSSDVCGSTQFAWILPESNEINAFRNTRASPGDVLKVFSALAKINLESHRNQVKNFILNRRGELFDSLSSEDPPNCREDANQVFCRWGRELYCNETIFPNVYQFFRNNKYRFLRNPEFEEDEEATAHQTMIEIFEEFTDGPRSTLCAFPPVFEARRFEAVSQVAADCVTGEEDDATLLEKGGQAIENLQQGLSDLWNSF